MSPPLVARDAPDLTVGSYLKQNAKLIAAGLIGGAAIVAFFVVAGIDRWWLRLFGAVAMTGVIIWLRFGSGRTRHVDTPPGLSPAAGVAYRGLMQAGSSADPFLLFVTAYMWTKVWEVHIQWSAPAFALISLAVAVWYHIRISDDVDEVPALFAKQRDVYTDFVADIRRINRNMFFWMFVVFAAVGAVSWLFD